MNSGNFLSAATLALIMKASMVSLTPDFSFSLFICTRKASSSVMSQSSWFVTCGISTQLRCRLAPLIFLIRDRSLRSTAPNLVKSTFGQGKRPRASPPPAAALGALAACALVWVAPLITALVKDCTSSCVMRPLGPEPFSSSSGTPSSRANLRTEGEACGSTAPTAAVGLWAGTAPADATAIGAAEDAATAGAATLAAGAATAGAPSAPWRIASKSPMLTTSPSLTFSSLMTPAADEGISIDALSDSTVISDCSTLTVSPALTNTSMTATSLKSPMSGTRTSTGPALATEEGPATDAGAGTVA